MIKKGIKTMKTYYLEFIIIKPKENLKLKLFSNFKL